MFIIFKDGTIIFTLCSQSPKVTDSCNCRSCLASSCHKRCKLLINPLYAGIQRCVCGMYIGRDEWGILFRAAEQIFYPQEYSAPIYVYCV